MLRLAGGRHHKHEFAPCGSGRTSTDDRYMPLCPFKWLEELSLHLSYVFPFLPGVPGLTAMPQMSVTSYSFIAWVSFQVLSTRTVKVTLSFLLLVCTQRQQDSCSNEGPPHCSHTQIAWLTNPAGNVVYPTTTSIISAVNDGGGLSSSILLLGTWDEYNVQRTLRAKKMRDSRQ